VYRVTQYQSAYEPYVIVSKRVSWWVLPSPPLLLFLLHIRTYVSYTSSCLTGAMSASPATARTRRRACSRCTSAASLFMFWRTIFSFIRATRTRKRRGVRRCVFSFKWSRVAHSDIRQRKYNRKLYADFKEETCLRYLDRYSREGVLHTDRGFNAQEECKKIKTVARLAAQVLEG